MVGVDVRIHDLAQRNAEEAIAQGAQSAAHLEAGWEYHMDSLERTLGREPNHEECRAYTLSYCAHFVPRK